MTPEDRELCERLRGLAGTLARFDENDCVDCLDDCDEASATCDFAADAIARLSARIADLEGQTVHIRQFDLGKDKLP